MSIQCACCCRERKIKVVCDDITRLDVEAVVNAANNRLSGGGGVDGAIHKAAGAGLADACAVLGGCPTGEARITPGFGLPAKWIIHTVGPVWQGGSHGEQALLEACYRSSCELALAHGIRSLAFPAISTGVYGYPADDAARVAMSVLSDYEARFDEIIACCFSEADRQRYLALIG